VKVSGFVRDVGSVSLDRMRAYAAEGILGNLYVQVEHNEAPGINRNLAAMDEWKAALPGHIYYWLWGTDSATDDAMRIYGHRLNLGRPHGWLLNDEADTVFADRSTVYVACGDEPIVVSCAGYPQITPIDHRHMSQYGAKVEYQAGGPDGENTFPAGALARECFEVSKVIQRDQANPAVWWYRVFFDNLLGPNQTIVRRWAWGQFEEHGPTEVTLIEGRNRWGVKATDADGYGRTLSDRIVFNRRTKRHVGRVYGLAQAKDIRVSLSVERPVTPAALYALAAQVRAGGAQRGVALYTLDNTSDEQFRAVAAIQ
jgi:hypothetical protein